MGRRMEALMPLVSLAAADGVLGYVNAAVTQGLRSLAKDTPLSIDRVQAARLYAGMLEFGYFSRGLEEECGRRGIPPGSDSEAMVRLADALPEEQLRSLCEVQTADAWFAAVRHVGGLFGLQPNPDLRYDSLALPYRELATTISDILLEPASAIPEHFSPPGTAQELMRRARRKADRGWGVGAGDVTLELPEADLVQFGVGPFGALLVEAAVLGVLLWEAEARVQGEFGYAMVGKAARAEHAAGGGGGGGGGE
ncbi:MAG: hypothetical protein J3K34DRAFT_441173 [Monoraphidium minutum]|nr:MAG: hypothetical protein J3K34DRAFT_441173 [Monoraphidium minutum]